MTYKALGRSIANYDAQMIASRTLTRYRAAQNEALRIITGSHKMSSIDHLHSETKMLKVEDHLNLLPVQYLHTENVCYHITKMDIPPSEMKETIFTRHYQTVLSLLANNRKDTLQALHTSFVNTAIDDNMKDNKYSTIDLHPSMTRNPSYRDDKGQLYHSPVPDIETTEFLQKAIEAVILQVVQTVEWIHRMYITWLIARLTPMICHL